MKIDHNHSFSILTESHLWHHRLIQKAKQIVRLLLGMKIYGPMGVVHSLFRGLKELGVDSSLYNFNPVPKNLHPTVCVLSGADTLDYAIQLKKEGVIKQIVAGPNISIPKDKNDIFFHPLVDKIVVPSQWVADYFVSLDHTLSSRILVWPAGVEDTGISKKKKNTILIYKKSCPQSLYAYIVSYMEKHHIAYDTIVYGSFTKQDYQDKINNAHGLIYLQESESQGLALQEAWIKDIPTLVWNRGYRKNQGITWNDQKISAPYLTDACGMFFSGEKDFEKALHLFLEKIEHKQFSARDYCLTDLTDSVSAALYLDILYTLGKK